MIRLSGVLPASAIELNTNCCNQITPADTAIRVCSDWITGKDAADPDGLFYDYRTRGFFFAVKKDYSRALADYNEALRLRPDWAGSATSMGSTEVYAYRANVWIIKNDKNRALADLDRAIRIAQPVAEKGLYYITRAGLLAEKGNTDRAIADYDASIPLIRNTIYESNIVEIYVKRGAILEKTGNLERARADYKSALMIKLSDSSSDQKERNLQATVRSRLASLDAPQDTRPPRPHRRRLRPRMSSPPRPLLWLRRSPRQRRRRRRQQSVQTSAVASRW